MPSCRSELCLYKFHESGEIKLCDLENYENLEQFELDVLKIRKMNGPRWNHYMNHGPRTDLPVSEIDSPCELHDCRFKANHDWQIVCKIQDKLRMDAMSDSGSAASAVAFTHETSREVTWSTSALSSLPKHQSVKICTGRLNGLSSPVVVTRPILDGLCGLPLPRAAQALGVSATSFKKACRRLGVRRWDYKRGPALTNRNRGCAKQQSAALDRTPPIRLQGDVGPERSARIHGSCGAAADTELDEQGLALMDWALAEQDGGAEGPPAEDALVLEMLALPWPLAPTPSCDAALRCAEPTRLG